MICRAPMGKYGSRKLPPLSPEHLKRLLDAFRAARSLPPTPLKTYMVVQQIVSSSSMMDDPVAVDYAVAEWLNSTIAAALTRQRHLYHLSGPEDDAALDDALKQLAADFHQQAVELEAWSMLYYRYVRVDLNLSWEQIEAVTNQDVRTLRRRQKRGLQRLVHWLLQEEGQARELLHRDRLRRALPARPLNELVGRTTLLEQAWQLLSAESGRRHLLFIGPGGIGKTALALTLAHRLIDEADLDNIAWLQLTAAEYSTDADLFAVLCETLRLPTTSAEALHVYCQSHDVLLVLDEAETVIGTKVFGDFLEQAADARVIVTSRRWQEGLPLQHIPVPELAEQDAAVIMERAWPIERPLDSMRRRIVWERVGGNPLALELAAGLVARLPQDALEDEGLFPAEAVPLEAFYERAWEQLDADARRFWLAAWLLPHDSVLHELLMLASGLSSETAGQAATYLGQLSLLSIDSDHRKYILHRIARAYLRQKIEAQQQVASWVIEASRRLSGAILGASYASRLTLHLIENAGMLALSVKDTTRLIQAAWPNVVHQGAWTTWRAALEKLVAVARPAKSDSLVLARLLSWLGITYRWLGLYEPAESCLRESLHWFEEKRHGPREHLYTLVELAVIQRHRGQIDTAFATVKRALAEFRDLGDAQGVERCELEMMQLRLEQRNPGEAVQRLKDMPVSSRSTALACEACLMLRDYHQALRLAERTVALAAHDRPNLARAHAMLGRVYLALGRLEDAADVLSIALSLMEQGRDVLGYARVLAVLAQVFFLKGNADDAVALLEEAIVEQRALNDHNALAGTLQLLLEILAQRIDDALAAGDADAVSKLNTQAQDVDAELQALVSSIGSPPSGSRI